MLFRGLKKGGAAPAAPNEASTKKRSRYAEVTSTQAGHEDAGANDQSEAKRPRDVKTAANAKRAKESEAMGTKEHRRNQKRKWIEPSPEGFFYVIIQSSRSTAPRLAELEDARSVVQWFRDTGFVGVRPHDGGGQPTDGSVPKKEFSTYVIRDGKIEMIKDATFETAEEAARAHDAYRKEFQLGYVRNFKRSYSTPGTYGRADLAFNESAKVQYRASVGRWGVTRVNMRFMRFACLRMLHSSRTARWADPQLRRREAWKAVRALLRLTRFWDAGHMMEGKDLREAFESLFVAWKAGDSLLVEEAGLLHEAKTHRGSESAEDGLAKQRAKAEKRIMDERCELCNLVLEQVDSMREAVNRFRRYPKRALKHLAWAWQPLRLFADLLRRLKATEMLKGFGEKRLEALSNDVFWGRMPQFLVLRGEFLLATGDLGRMLEAQALFVRAMDADPVDTRAVMALAHAEHLIAQARRRALNVNLVSVSQRTTQDVLSDEEEEEEEHDRARRKEENAPRRITNAVRQNPDNVGNWLAMEALLFGEDEEETAGDGSDEALEGKRACLLRLVKIQPSIALALPRLHWLWRISKDASRDARVDIFFAVADVLEALPQRECPSFGEFFSAATVPLWELAVVCLHTLPLGAAVFASEARASLWRRRFFPDIACGIFQDPFAFTRTHRYAKRTRNRRHSHGDAASDETNVMAQFREDHYLYALKAVVGSMTEVAPEYYVQVAQAFTAEFVNKICVLKAVQEVEARTS